MWGNMSEFKLSFGCQIISYGDVGAALQYSILAEKSGFDTITLPDHLFHPSTKGFLEKPPWEVFTVLSAIGVKTKKVKLMPAVTDSLRRHPALLAHTIATLDHLTNGRIMLGIGAGETFNVVPLKDIRWEKPFTRLKETIEIIKLLWSSTKEKPATYRGEFFKVEEAYLAFKPLQKPNPPIYVGGYGPRMRRLVGECCDGWIPWMHSPKIYRKDLKIIAEAAERVGRSLDEIDTAVMTQTVVLRNREKAWRIIAPRARMGLTLRATLLKELGYEELANESTEVWKLSLNSRQIKKLQEVAKKIPFEVVEEVNVAGTTEDAIEKIAEYAKAGVKHFIAIPLMPRFKETLKAYKDKIIPYFRSL